MDKLQRDQPREAAVTRAVGRLSRSLDVLEAALSSLASALSPVLHPGPATSPASNASTPVQTCPLAEVIEGYADRITNLAEQVHALQARLEV